MIYIKLFYNFFMIGLFSIGGGYAAISFASDMAKEFDVISTDMISDFVAIAESTPGPFAVNFATFVGTKTAGLPGAIVATTAIVLPAFFIILLFIIFLKDIISNTKYKIGLSIIRSCVIGIILAAGINLLYHNLLGAKSIIIAVLLIIEMYIYKKIKKKPESSILVIAIGALLGIAINFVL